MSNLNSKLSGIKKNSLLGKFLSFSVGNWLVLIIGLISSPIITRIIEPVEYGKFGMFNLYASILMLIITCGLDQSYVRFFYEEDEVNRNKLLFESIKIPFILNIIISIIIIIFKVPISKYIISEYNPNFIILLILNITLASISRFSLLTVRMKQKGRLYSMLQVMQKLSYLMSIALFFMIYNNSFLTLAYATLISNVVVAGISIFTERDSWNFKNIKDKKLKNSQLDILKYGIPLIFTVLVTWLFQSADKMAIKAFCGDYEVGIYSSANSIIAILNILQTSFATFWIPVAFEKYEKTPEDTKFFSNINDIVSFFMFGIGIGIILFKDVIVLILGPKYRTASYIMPFLVFMPVLYTMSEVSVGGINFKKKPKYHIVIASIACLFNVIGNGILVPTLGAKGAGISTGLAYIVLYYARTLISRRLYKVDYSIGRTTVAILAISILALYTSFMEFSFITIIIGIIVILIVLFLYRNTIKSMKDMIFKDKKIKV
ncbi:MAG: polysaccharide biosynthesis protein [Clostridium sulfidigenes]|uniref:Polysaccharide biosynthesis protein n=1 Tax=Clostridium sulfidigenes TaxID=318464 RepID=A0A927ZTM5_9CLOT|nr:polysaccharide biosynthesis protein [Clostridium sulfidigenes]